MNAVEFFKSGGVDVAKSYLKTPQLDDEFEFYQELRRLVDSWELVEKYGGIEGAKDYLSGRFIQHHMSAFIKIKKAIEDMEKCQ